MKHPPYHLRLNKAVDRLTLIDAMRRWVKLDDLSKYTYYGMGGPYLEDFRLLYEFYPEIKMVSVEEDEDTFKRQQFHIPCRSSRLELKKTEFKSFIAQYDPKDEKSIFWLDYTGLEYGNFEDFKVLLGKVAANSVIKITLRSNPIDYIGKAEEFRKKFETLMPQPSVDPPAAFEDFASLVQEMAQIASETALPAAMPMMFQPVSSICYNDGVGMFTLTGIVSMRADEASVRKAFKKWQFANLDWGKPTEINVPILSTKERLHLQRRLPCRKNAGKTLRRTLGYLIDENDKKTETSLQQYADFHRFFPYFMKAIP